jgi:hypothetical protein
MTDRPDGWKPYEDAIDRGPWPTFWKWGGMIVAMLFILTIVGICTGFIGGTVQEAATTAQKQFGPAAAVVKYEWFKDAAAALDKQRANLVVYEQRLLDFDAQYKGVARAQWPRDDREAYQLMRSEYAGVEAAYNELAAQYNANMSKVNWQWASASLPREIAPYNRGGNNR